jgi:hypothetical protein
MQPKPATALWMGSAFCAAFGLAAVILGIGGVNESGIDRALAATARLSFLFFWPAYAGGAIVALFGPTFQPLKRHGRELGLAFASALLVHVGLVTWLCLIGAAPSVSTFVLFGTGLVWTYLLALFSIGRLHRALNPKLWWVLRTVGLNYILYAFAVDFSHFTLHGGTKQIVEYLPFAILVVIAPVLRLAAFALRIGHFWRRFSLRPGAL